MFMLPSYTLSVLLLQVSAHYVFSSFMDLEILQ
jgi:hypothetical protein